MLARYMPDILTALMPVVLALLTLFARWAMRTVSTRVKDQRLAAAIQLLSTGASIAVANAYQTVVKDLKDPSKPGKWDEKAANSVKMSVLADMRAVYPEALSLVQAAAANPASTETLLSQLIEKAVLELQHKNPATNGILQ